MKPEEYGTYFEDFIFSADTESGRKNPFAEVSLGRKTGETHYAFGL